MAPTAMPLSKTMALRIRGGASESAVASVAGPAAAAQHRPTAPNAKDTSASESSGVALLTSRSAQPATMTHANAKPANATSQPRTASHSRPPLPTRSGTAAAASRPQLSGRSPSGPVWNRNSSPSDNGVDEVRPPSETSRKARNEPNSNSQGRCATAASATATATRSNPATGAPSGSRRGARRTSSTKARATPAAAASTTMNGSNAATTARSKASEACLAAVPRREPSRGGRAAEVPTRRLASSTIAGAVPYASSTSQRPAASALYGNGHTAYNTRATSRPLRLGPSSLEPVAHNRHMPTGPASTKPQIAMFLKSPTPPSSTAPARPSRPIAGGPIPAAPTPLSRQPSRYAPSIVPASGKCANWPYAPTPPVSRWREPKAISPSTPSQTTHTVRCALRRQVPRMLSSIVVRAASPPSGLRR